ncbi:MAG TPA: hypothetical protein DD733_12815 [Clostridiales bacterium]|nr:hypothetical protein [Clostridiales bacterium]
MLFYIIKLHIAGEKDNAMRCTGKTIGVAALTFGGGVLLCALLPSGVLVCVQAAIIVTTGFFLFCK